MTGFLLLAALLVAGALLLVLPPMLGFGRRRRVHAERQRQADTALLVLREQLAELEADHASGKVPDAEYERSREELELRALEEGRTVDDGSDARPARFWAAGLALAVPLVAVVVYLGIGEPDGVDPEKIAGDPGHQVSAAEMAELVEQLVDRLERDPSDPTGWLMLARSYSMMGNFEGAARAWRRIGDKAPNDAGILADWADVLVVAQHGEFSGEPDTLIARSLALEPDNFKALALAGTSAFQSGDFALASSHWERILDRVNPGDEAYGSIVSSINEARSRGGMPLFGEQSAPAPVGPAASADSAVEPLRVNGVVSLAAELAATMRADETVFVFVRPAEGGIPLAALRLSAGDLPARFDFDGVPLMAEGPLPSRVIVAARLSRSGDAGARAGDLEGFSELVAPDADDVQVVIDKVRE
ncbi:MAG TPA: c-type cytochrome biogenesis protein CcmI [Rhodocyclaceae bacterium]|nr:c-type cytochrome biogenesis protein CcmI [Rhodocyclaceae bacterium]HRQ46303.1 c-type cytochrome biogenesis protein CcmI [Rhodocyclaceae bacterium]